MKNNYNGNKAELGDTEAYALFNMVLSGVDSQGNHVEVGRAFRESCHFQQHNDRASWELPPPKYRLDVDNVVKRLMERDRDPYISKTKNNNSSALLHSSPYSLVRSHMEFFISFLRDPAEENKQVDIYISYLKQINRAKSALEPVLSQPWWEIGKRQSRIERLYTMGDLGDPPKHTPTSASVIALQQQIETAHDALEKLGTIVETEFTHIQMQRTPTGRPRLLWRDYFVWRMAHLWRVLTGCEPSKNHESLFGEFVYACWNSLDDNMPDVSFDHTIRNLPDETGM